MLTGKCHCGGVNWTLKATPEAVTACNCSICHRYGALWAYGYINDDIHSFGKTTTYRRKDGGGIDFHFCAKCGCVTHYVKTFADESGRHRTAVNLRLSDPNLISNLSIDRFDGLKTFDYLPRDGRILKDMCM